MPNCVAKSPKVSFLRAISPLNSVANDWLVDFMGGHYPPNGGIYKQHAQLFSEIGN